MRSYRASPSDKSQYGDYLGEFLWRMRFLRSADDSWRRNSFWQCLKVLRFKYKPPFVEPDCRWEPAAELKASVDALEAAAALPRSRRPGGRYGKRPRQLAIEDGAVEEVVEEADVEVLLRVCKRVPFVLCATDLSLRARRGKKEKCKGQPTKTKIEQKQPG